MDGLAQHQLRRLTCIHEFADQSEHAAASLGQLVPPTERTRAPIPSASMPWEPLTGHASPLRRSARLRSSGGGALGPQTGGSIRGETAAGPLADGLRDDRIAQGGPVAAPSR